MNHIQRHLIDQRPLNFLGQKSLTITYQQQSCNQNIIKDLKNNPLGLPAIWTQEMHFQLNKLSFCNIPYCSQNWGHLLNCIPLKLSRMSSYLLLVPDAIFPSHWDLKYNLNCSICNIQGVIFPVQEPTPWCVPMVVVPKDLGAVQIYGTTQL